MGSPAPSPALPQANRACPGILSFFCLPFPGCTSAAGRRARGEPRRRLMQEHPPFALVHTHGEGGGASTPHPHTRRRPAGKAARERRLADAFCRAPRPHLHQRRPLACSVSNLQACKPKNSRGLCIWWKSRMENPIPSAGNAPPPFHPPTPKNAGIALNKSNKGKKENG